jgi:hypothetical protein
MFKYYLLRDVSEIVPRCQIMDIPGDNNDCGLYCAMQVVQGGFKERGEKDFDVIKKYLGIERITPLTAEQVFWSMRFLGANVDEVGICTYVSDSVCSITLTSNAIHSKVNHLIILRDSHFEIVKSHVDVRPIVEILMGKAESDDFLDETCNIVNRCEFPEFQIDLDYEASKSPHCEIPTGMNSDHDLIISIELRIKFDREDEFFESDIAFAIKLRNKFEKEDSERIIAEEEDAKMVAEMEEHREIEARFKMMHEMEELSIEYIRSNLQDLTI